MNKAALRPMQIASQQQFHGAQRLDELAAARRAISHAIRDYLAEDY